MSSYLTLLHQDIWLPSSSLDEPSSTASPTSFDGRNHPLRSAGLAPGTSDAGVTRPHLSRLTQDTASDSSNDDNSSDKNNDQRERLVIVHKVSPKDSLPGVSLRYGIPLADLRRVNQLWASDPIHLRDVLYIPVDKATAYAQESNKADGTLGISPSVTIQRVPASKLSFFPPSRATHRRRRRHSLTDVQIPTSYPATLSRSHSRNHSLHSTRLTSFLTSLPIAASTRDDIVARLSFDSVSSSFDDRSKSEGDNEETHELEEVVTRLPLDNDDQARTSRSDVYNPPKPDSILHRRGNMTHTVLPSPPLSSYIPPASSLSIIRTVQMEPSPTMQIPKRTNNTLIHDRRFKDGKTDGLSTRSTAYSSAHNLMETDATNRRLLR